MQNRHEPLRKYLLSLLIHSMTSKSRKTISISLTYVSKPLPFHVFAACILISAAWLLWLKKSKYKSQKFVIGDENVGHGDRLAEACRQSERRGDRFAGHGGHSVHKETWGSFCGAHGSPAPPPSRLCLFLIFKILRQESLIYSFAN